MSNVLGGSNNLDIGPRGILKRQIERLKDRHITITIGATVDFYLFNGQYEKVILKNSPPPYFDTKKRGMIYCFILSTTSSKNECSSSVLSILESQ